MTEVIPVRPRPASTALALLLALLVAVVLQLAAVAKIAGPDTKKLVDLLGDPVRLDYLIAIGEIAFVMLLLLAWRTRHIWLAVSLLFASFSGYALFYLLRGKPCGCFGKLLDGTWLEFLTVHGVSFGIDVAFFAAALVMAALRRVRPALITATAVLGLAGSGAAYWYARISAPPTAEQAVADPVLNPSGLPPEQTLMQSDLMADIALQGSDWPAWLVLVYSPDCHVCQEARDFYYIPYEMESTANDDPILKVRMVAKEDLERDLQIPYYAWTGSPVVLLVQNGVITRQWANEDYPRPAELRAELEAGQPPAP